ncbi:YajG family lipoprotein [Thalassolituus sp.]|jgi:uncharacterized lipoprotein|uniref:YajG family lipoprotein n=1 Tax=Thalassolituus sp. TaxID=2030822 RepID=UPI003518E348|nr:MAG: hypothetical protein CSH36_00970 [Thalassolituus sp.]
MRKLLAAAVLATGVLSLTGCVLAPQTIQLNETSAVAAPSASVARGALIRVIDQREDASGDVLGSRGGRLAENSPLVAQDDLAAVLTTRLQDSMTQLGFGEASPLEPLKVQLVVDTFRYGCNDGFLVTDCSVSMKFEMTVINGATTFTKPYGLNESRRVAAAPVQEYNEKWINDTLDRLWSYIFNDPELRTFLGI